MLLNLNLWSVALNTHTHTHKHTMSLGLACKYKPIFERLSRSGTGIIDLFVRFHIFMSCKIYSAIFGLVSCNFADSYKSF